MDRGALTLAALGCGLAFAGVSVLTGLGFSSPVFIALVAAGVACLVALMVVEYRGSDSLMPVGQLSSTLPVAGILGAMAAVALLAILRTFLIEVEGMSALQADALLWPLLAGVVCLGLGTGASVAPGLFSAAYCLPVKQIGRTFAVVELLRSAAAFLLAPVVLAIAMNGAGGGPAALSDGLRTAALIAVVVTAVAAAIVVAVALAGGVRLHRPRVDEWLAGEDTAFHSPPLGAAVRRGRREERGELV